MPSHFPARSVSKGVHSLAINVYVNQPSDWLSNEAIRLMLAESFRKNGYTIANADDSFEALIACQVGAMVSATISNRPAAITYMVNLDLMVNLPGCAKDELVIIDRSTFFGGTEPQSLSRRVEERVVLCAQELIASMVQR